MAGPHALRVLVAEHDPGLAGDFRSILTPRRAPTPARGELPAGLEAELFGAVSDHKRFPEIDLTLAPLGEAALEAVRVATAEARPFALAFVDLDLAPGLDGLQTAEQIRALDPDLAIVLLSARAAPHPIDLCERIPPADQLYLLKKPVHPAEIQQLFLALSARWRSLRHGAGQARSGVPDRLENLPAGVQVFDRRDRLVSANDRMLQLFPELAELCVPGTPYAEVQRQLALRLLPESTLVRVESWVEDRLDWHARSGGALEQKLRGGRWALVVEGAAASSETYCLYYDITELKRREARRATMAHMTQTAQCFAGLCEQLDLVLGRPEDRPGRGPGGADGEVAVLPVGLARRREADPAGALAGRLRAIAQRQRLAPEAAVLNRLVGEVVRQVRAELPNWIEVEVIAGAGLWPTLIDGERFAAALVELIRNACEAMSGGGRLVLETANIRLSRDYAATRDGLPAGEYVRVSVQDTGPGMSAVLAQRALNPFFTSKTTKDHLGLGLSVVYGFAQQSGGYLEIEGGEGRGATINLYFPRTEDAARAPDKGHATQTPTARRAPRRVAAD